MANKYNQAVLQQAPRQGYFSESFMTPFMNLIMSGGSLNNEGMQMLQAEILSRRWLARRRSLGPLYSTMGSTSADATPQMLVVHQRLSAEIWLQIWSYLLEPRVLKIEMARDRLPLALAVDTPLIPGPLFLIQAAKIETLKTHKVAFAGLFDQPILFDNKRDILHFQPNALSFIANTAVYHINATSNQQKWQQWKVHFLALSLETSADRLSNFSRSLDLEWMVRRVLTSLESIFIIKEGGHHALEEQDESFLRLGYRLKRSHMLSKARWNETENAGEIVQGKWNLPKVFIVSSEKDLLAASRGEVGHEV